MFPASGDRAHHQRNRGRRASRRLCSRGLLLALGRMISGTITDVNGGAALSGITVRAYTSGGASTGINGVTDSSGLYTISGLVDGSYFVRTSNSVGYVDRLYPAIDCPNGNCTLATGTAVAVTASATTPGINLALNRGATISGAVTAASTGAAIPSIGVQAYTATGTSLGGATSDAAGAFSISGLPAGTYYLRTTGTQLGYLYQAYGGKNCDTPCSIQLATPLTVSLGSQDRRRQLPPRRRRGHHRDRDGRGRRRRPGGREHPRVQLERGLGRKPGHDRRLGGYSVSGLAAGSYFVLTMNQLGYGEQLYAGTPCSDFSCVITRGTPVNTAEATTDQRHRLHTRTGRLDHRHRHGVCDGQPVVVRICPGVQRQRDIPRWRVLERQRGVHQISALPAGTYYVRTTSVPPGTPTGTRRKELHLGLPAGHRHPGLCHARLRDPRGRFRARAGRDHLRDRHRQRRSSGIGDRTGFTTATAARRRAQPPMPPASSRFRAWPRVATSFARRTRSASSDQLYSSIGYPDSTCSTLTGTPVSVVEGSTTSGIDFALTQGGSISGSVTLAGAPIRRSPSLPTADPDHRSPRP